MLKHFILIAMFLISMSWLLPAADAAMTPCTTSADCSGDAIRPYCNPDPSDQVCTQCRYDSDCPSGKICDPNALNAYSRLCITCSATVTGASTTTTGQTETYTLEGAGGDTPQQYEIIISKDGSTVKDCGISQTSNTCSYTFAQTGTYIVSGTYDGGGTCTRSDTLTVTVGTSGPFPTSSATCDDVAQGTSCDSSRDGSTAYCSYGKYSEQADGFCCEKGSWWDGVACLDYNDCYQPSDSRFCEYSPTADAYYNEDRADCTDTANTLSCCDMGDFDGDGNTNWEFQNYIPDDANDQVEFCGGGTTSDDRTVTCDADGVCAEDFGITCSAKDPDCGGNNVINTGEECDGTNLNGENCVTQGYDGGSLSCNADSTFNTAGCTYRPTITAFSATSNGFDAPGPTSFDIGIQDDNNGFTYSIAFGDTTSWGPSAASTSTSVSLTGVHQHHYQQANTYTATLTVTDSHGVTASATETISVNPNDGNWTGQYATDPANCADTACYGSHPVFPGACYSDGGQEVCLEQYSSLGENDQICAYNSATGTWTFQDKDASLVLATQSTRTCTAVDYITDEGWCEDAATQDLASGRCDTADNPAPDANGLISGFACGDDPNEQYHEYIREGITYYGCLQIDATACFGMDRGDDEHSYTQTATETCVRADYDDTDCDGIYPRFDNDCHIEIHGNVYVNESGNDYWTKAGDAEVTTTDEFGTVTETRANSLGNYSITGVIWGLRDIAALWLGYLDTDSTISPDFDPASVNTNVDLYITERSCDTGCSSGGNCDRACLGQNECPDLSEMTLEQALLFNKSAPIHASKGRDYDARILVDWNETHKLVGTHCIEEIAKVPAPRAEVKGNMSNLIKWTRLVTYQGTPVRLVVAAWN